MTGATAWICRCLKGVGRDPVRFLDALEAAQGRTIAVAAEDWVPRPAVAAIAREGFAGQPADLYASVCTHKLAQRGHPRWPKGSPQFSQELNARAEELRRAGIVVERTKKGSNANWVAVRFEPPTAPEPPAEAEPLPLLPPDVIERMQRQYENAIGGLPEGAQVGFDHRDGTYTLWGTTVEEAAKKLSRDPEPGRHLRVRSGEWRFDPERPRIIIPLE